MFGVASTVVYGGRAEKDEGVDGTRNEGEEVWVGERVDVVEAEGGGDAEGGGQSRHDFWVVL